MKPVAVIALALMSGSAASAQSRFDGSWKLEPDAGEFSPRTFNISLQRGLYSCSTCRPAWSVPADGAFHAVPGRDDFDETSVQVVDDHTVVFTRRLAGRGVYQAIDRISGDQQFLTFAVTEFSGAGKPIWTTGTWTRLTPQPAHSHPITGTWRELRPDVMSDNVSTFTIRTDGHAFNMTFGTGESLTARFDGPPTTVQGDPSGMLVSVRKISDTSFQETDTRNGAAVAVRTSTVLGNGTLEIVSRRPNGKVTRQTAHRLTTGG